MINLNEKFNHYLHTSKKPDCGNIDESLIGYGWHDDGENIVGYYLLTKDHKHFYNLKHEYVGKEPA